MKLNLILLCTFGLTILAVHAQSSDEPATGRGRNQDLALKMLQTEAVSEIKDNPLTYGNIVFAVELYSKLRKTKGNLMFSPYSISSALAMTYAGARGETSRQLETALHFGSAKTNVHERFRQLNGELNLLPGSNQLSIANSLWPADKYPFHEKFLGLLKTNYGATITPLDYTGHPEAASTAINDWVSDHTQQKISGIIGPGDVSALTSLIMVNAIYFKGTWADPFSEKLTQPDKFFLQPERTESIPFMRRHGSFYYAEPTGLQVLIIPYAGKHLEMVVLLPRQRDGLESLETNLNSLNLVNWLVSAQLVKFMDVNVIVPKFKMTATFDLAKSLGGLGIKDAFDPRHANFSGMDGQTNGLYLSRAAHKAFIEVNEQGTEAAAATAIVSRACN